MKPGSRRLVPVLKAALATAAGLTLGGCLGTPNVDADSPLVVREDAPAGIDRNQFPRRREAAVAEMRMKGVAGDTMPFPDAFATAQRTRLAAREEPRTVPDVDAVEAELAAIARRKRYTTSPQELAVLKARAAELQRLAAEAQALAASRSQPRP